MRHQASWSLTAFAVASACSPATGDTMTNAAALGDRLKKELPVGTTREAVIAYLDAAQVEHSGSADANVINAIWRGVSRNGPVTQSARADFKFDDTGRLQSVSVDDQFTGP